MQNKEERRSKMNNDKLAETRKTDRKNADKHDLGP